ncbi:hypothetical protein PTMSG1_03685 [Pyrenophora teres f. maculata]|nr:hypothetical protein PTMSG1_03685 [Pyrenophora teres f. maculata]
MQFSIILFAVVLALTSHTTASALITPATASVSQLDNWKVTNLKVQSPSNFPGRYPWATISAKVKDPNRYNLGVGNKGHSVIVSARKKAVKCEAKINIANDKNFLHRAWPCDRVKDGYWTMQIIPSFESKGKYVFTYDDFILRFTHVASKLHKGVDPLKLVAEGHFDQQHNTKQTGCKHEHICNWRLSLKKWEIIPSVGYI